MNYALPTVRVVNPARPDTFMTINRHEFGAGHDLWPEQEEGFTPIPQLKPVIDPAERNLAAEILGRMVPAHFGIPSEDWLGLSGSERLDMMRAFEMDAASAKSTTDTLTVVKGPRGFWYVVRGDERVSKGMPDEAAAMAERERMTA